jgi:putative Mg2+ transporter-C (MgtC) family protein
VEEQVIMILRILLSAALGALVGYERELHNRWAGFRTHILVCVGSCLVMLTSIYLSRPVNGQAGADPGRLAAQVVSGIGFLGAGTILHSSSRILGLTTAANLWMIAAVGLAVGCGLYLPAIATTVLAYVILKYLGPLENLFHSKRIKIPWLLDIVAQGSAAGYSEVFELLDLFGLAVQNVKIDNLPDGVRLAIEIQAMTTFDEALFEEKLRQLACVSEASMTSLQEDYQSAKAKNKARQ